MTRSNPGTEGVPGAAAVITVDLDGESVWRDMTGGNPSPLQLSQGRFGPLEGARNLVGIFEEVGVPATFFVPAETALAHQGLVRELADRGFEVAAHGLSHQHPRSLAPDEEVRHLGKSVEVLTDITGIRPRGYRAPAFDISENTLGLLASMGFLYDSSLMDSERPYVTAEGIVEIPVSWSLDDWNLYGESTDLERAAMVSAVNVARVLGFEFEALTTAGLPFVLVLHPQLSGRTSRARAIGSFLETARKKAGVSWTTMDSLAERVLRTQS